jgi:hypothetical protein
VVANMHYQLYNLFLFSSYFFKSKTTAKNKKATKIESNSFQNHK